jgi:hypothetical protein
MIVLIRTTKRSSHDRSVSSGHRQRPALRAPFAETPNRPVTLDVAGSIPVPPAGHSVRPLPLTQVENRAERGVAPNQLGVLRRGRAEPRCVAHSGSGGASALRATCCRTVSSDLRREERIWLNRAGLVGRGRVVSGVLMDLQAGGHRFDPGTLHLHRRPPMRPSCPARSAPDRDAPRLTHSPAWRRLMA